MTDTTTTTTTATVAPSGAPAAELPASAVPDQAYAERMLNATMADTTITSAADAQAKAAGTTRPDSVPEKFWDATKGTVNTEALLKSYGDLEKAFSSKQGDKPADEAATETKTPEADKATIDRPEGEQKTEGEAAPLTAAVESLRNAYAKGEVTDEVIKPLTDAGLPREVVDTYLAGVKALETVSLMNAHTAAGGKEQFDSAVAWARSDLSDADLDFYNTQVSNPATANQAIEWLMGKFKGANPTEGRRIAATTAAAGGDTFESMSQMQDAMKDPKYGKDPSFRQAVAEKLQRSIQAGKISLTAQRYTR